MAKGGWVKEPATGPRQYVGVHVADHRLEDLDRAAQAAQRSRAALIREAIDRYLDELEDAA